MKDDFTVRTPDGAVDPVQTALNKMRSGQPLESDVVLKRISAEEYVEVLEEKIKGLHIAWNKESERVSGYKTYVLFLWFIIAILLVSILIMKIS
jgi:hypothetical protein